MARRLSQFLDLRRANVSAASPVGGIVCAKENQAAPGDNVPVSYLGGQVS
jgi:hypothetical protein